MQPASLTVLALTLFWSASAQAEFTVKAITKPGMQVALNPMVDGRISRILVAEGHSVRRGQLLIQLDDDVQAARVLLTQRAANQRGNIEKAQQQIARLKMRLNRLRLARAGSVPKWEIEDAAFKVRIAQTDLKLARDSLAVEQGKLALEKKILSQYVLKAPFAGQVVELKVDDGATVKRSEALVTIADMSKLDAIAYIPAKAVSNFKSGTTYVARVGAPFDREFNAHLKFVDQRLEPASRTFRAVFEISNSKVEIPSGTEIAISDTAFRDLDK